MPMQRMDWLLLYIGLPAGPYPVDQLRAMKGLFLFSKEGPKEAADLYHFEAYDYGPFDVQIYHDVSSLTDNGLVYVEREVGTSQRIYRLTAKGEKRLASLVAQANTGGLDVLAQIKKLTTSLSFLELLRHVYGKYPEYAVRSVARL